MARRFGAEKFKWDLSKGNFSNKVKNEAML